MYYSNMKAMVMSNVCEKLPVYKFSSDTSLEEATAAVTCQDAVVFSTGCVSTYDAGQTW